jgi:virulence factor Mce-like protein
MSRVRRRSSSSALASPVLVGAVTVLVTIVAVFLAYNANSGLPFVPTTELNVLMPNGANLVKGNEVRSGGYRVGVVGDMAPVRLPGGKTGARITLKLDKRVGDIPRDSSFRVRPRSALGLKYVELSEGTSRQSWRNGDTVPLDRSSVPVELDEVLSTFDAPTREGMAKNLVGWGDALAGRGPGLGRTIEELPPLFGHLTPVMTNLADPSTDTRGFFKELADTVRVIAPVSKTNAALFTSMADTFEAVGRDPEALKSTISKAPGTEDVAIDSFRVQRPFLSDLAAFSTDLKGATSELRAALPTVNRAIEKGTPVQERAVALNDRLQDTMGALEELTTEPATNTALRGLTATVTTLNPQLRYYGPFVTVCNSWNYFWTNVAEHFSEEDITGSAQRALFNFAGQQDNSLGAMGATAPANGENVKRGNAQYFQGQVYGAAITPNGRADCEAGQRGFLERQAKGAPKKYLVARDPRTPGAQGPTYTGRPQVPKGQTYTFKPETGPYAQMPPSESGDP